MNEEEENSSSVDMQEIQTTDEENYMEMITQNFPIHPISHIKQMIVRHRVENKISPSNTYLLMAEYQKFLSNHIYRRDYVKKTEISDIKTISRQERTINSGYSSLTLQVNETQKNTLESSLSRAVLFMDRRLITPEDVVSTLTKQLESPSIPYTITGLTTSTILTGVITSQIKMRPNGIDLMKSLIKDDDVFIVNEITKKVTIKPFKTQIATMSYVQKKIPYSIGNGFFIRLIYNNIEDNGDSFFLQSPRNYLEIENTTLQTVGFEQLNRIMSKIAVSINPNFDDLTRHYHTKSPVYIKMKSFFNGYDIMGAKERKHKMAIIRPCFAFFNDEFDMISAELVFEEISQVRNFLMETKSIISPEYNATLRQKFRNITTPICSCREKNIIVYGSGSINSALSTHILKKYSNYNIELVDPVNDFCVDKPLNGGKLIISSDRYETYKPLRNHYCLVVSDIGTLEASRNHFTNDYRFTNHAATYLYRMFQGKHCKMVLKAGFAANLEDIPAIGIWHYKPHNPEFWIETQPITTFKVSDILKEVYLEKLYFNAIRQKNWKNDRLVIGYSNEFPLYKSMDYLTTELPFHINRGSHIPYSNSINSKRLIPYSKPHLGFLTPEFTAAQKLFVSEMGKLDTIDKKIIYASESELLPQDKFYLIAHIMSKQVTVIGSRLKNSLGVGSNDKEAISNTTMTDGNKDYLYAEKKTEGGFSKINTITPKVIDICVDYDSIKKNVIERTLYNDFVTFSF